MIYKIKNTSALAVVLAIGMVWGCKHADEVYYPEVVIDKFTNDTLKIDGLPAIVRPGGYNNNGATEGDQLEKEVLHKELFIGAGKNADLGNFIDLSTGQVYNNQNVVQNNHQVDLMMINFETTSKYNLITPDAKEIAYNDYGNDIQRGWDRQNNGEVFRLKGLTRADVDWFNKTIKNAALKKGIDSFINEIIPSRNAAEYANVKSRKRLRDVNAAEFIFFKSADRNIYSAIAVISISGDVATGKEAARLIIKSDISTKTNVNAGSGILKADRNDLDRLVVDYDPSQDQFINLNLAAGQVYKTAAEIPSKEDVYVTVGFRASNKSTAVYTTSTADANYTALGTDYTTIISAIKPTTNYTRMQLIGNHVNYADNQIENVAYSTISLKNYMTALISGTAGLGTYLTLSNTYPYPYIARFAKLAGAASSSSVLEYGVFAFVSNDTVNGKMIFAYKYSTIRD